MSNLEITGYVENPFVNSGETEELADNTTESMTETEAVYEDGELKLKEVDETEELEDNPVDTDTEIEQLRRTYKNYKKAEWSEPANRIRGKLVAALEEKRSSVNSEIDDLRSYSPDEKKENLKSERRELTAEIEELSA